ncbi:MAG: di-heme oxidoredictase family protein [Planctomycetota bacterium]
MDLRRGLALSLLTLGAFGVAVACSRDDREAAAPARDPRLAGGATTVFNTSPNAFALEAANLSAARSDLHVVGNSLFNKNWVAAPASPEARDGLGPLFNARSCSACHFKDGRGKLPEPGEQPVALLFKVGTRSAEGVGTAEPHPAYGSQFQNFALPGAKPEGRIEIRYVEEPGTYADGTAYSLRRPEYRAVDPGYGDFGPSFFVTPRIAPQVFGMGLLELVPEADLVAREDVDDRDGDGVSGRANRVADLLTGETRLGRFGWKAGQPSVDRQSAAAFSGDMGLSTPVVAGQNHTSAQADLDRFPTGGEPEVEPRLFDAVVFYMRTLGVPARRQPGDPVVRRGERLFVEARCDACHVPELRTGASEELPELSEQIFTPYTDLLLHDMGDGLADDRPEGLANGREWRTAPLWGIGLIPVVNGHSELLHDGRARGVAEAILWHGGEAESSREAFRRMSAEDRAALIAFVEDL